MFASHSLNKRDEASKAQRTGARLPSSLQSLNICIIADAKLPREYLHIPVTMQTLLTCFPRVNSLKTCS